MNKYPDPTWFSMTAVENFKHFLIPHLTKDSKSLQLGVFTGDASLWLMENTATDLIDVDTWEGSGDEPGVISEYNFEEVYYDYARKVDRYLGDRITVKFDSTQKFLKNLDPHVALEQYDFIYIDADHTAKAVMADAVNAEPLLKVGGLLAFDDYTWRCGDMIREPWMAIDMFQAIYRDKFEVLVKNAQYWLRKIA